MMNISPHIALPVGSVSYKFGLQVVFCCVAVSLTAACVLEGAPPRLLETTVSQDGPLVDEADYGSGLADLENLVAAEVEASDETFSDEAESSSVESSEFADVLAELADGDIPDLLSRRPAGKLLEPDLQPAKFNGVQPGISSRDELIENWGEPVEIHDTDLGELFVYDTKPFRRIEVLVVGKLVDVVKVELARHVAPEKLAAQLHLDVFVSAAIRSETGKVVARVFPERGVLLMLESEQSSSPQLAESKVGQLVIQPLDPTAFTLRVESRLHGPYQENLLDLNRALQLHPEMAHAHWLRAEIYLATGQGVQAEQSAARAVELAPKNDAYRTTWSRALEEVGRLDDAVLAVRKVIDEEGTPEVIQAKAYHQLGRLSNYGDAEIMRKGLTFHNRAIALADKLVNDQDAQTRRQARETLIRSHLEVARSLSRQSYSNDQKIQSLSQWIGRASGLVEDYIDSDEGGIILRMEVAEASLDGMTELKPTRDPGPWVKEADGAAEILFAEHDDLLWQRRVRWLLGCCQYHAVRIEHTRANRDEALRYGGEAIENLADAAKSRVAVPSAQALVGNLYFHVGAVHAVHSDRHDKALSWYEKAMPLLLAERPDSELAVPRREGECLVSMGVSYWSEDRRAEALEFTLAGTELVESAVIGGVLPPNALLVPYGNLASMHEELGNAKESQRYEQLSSDVKSGRKFAKNAGGEKNSPRESTHSPSKSLLDSLTEHKNPNADRRPNQSAGASTSRAPSPQTTPRLSRQAQTSPDQNQRGYRSRPRW